MANSTTVNAQTDPRQLKLKDLLLSKWVKIFITKCPELMEFDQDALTLGDIIDRFTLADLQGSRFCGPETLREFMALASCHGLAFRRGSLPEPKEVRILRAELEDFMGIIRLLHAGSEEEQVKADAFILCYGLPDTFKWVQNKDAAAKLGISEKTVGLRLSAVWRRLWKAGFARNEFWLLDTMEKIRTNPK